MAHRGLETARRRLGLSYVELWIDYFALGGGMDPDQLVESLRGDRDVSDIDHDVLTQALNEVLQDRGHDSPLGEQPLET